MQKNNKRDTLSFNCISNIIKENKYLPYEQLSKIFKPKENYTHLKNEENQTLLHIAIIYKSFYTIIHLLINNNINPDEQDIHGKTPMHYAVLDNNIFNLITNTSLSFDMEIKDNNGKTPYDYIHM